MSGKPRTLPGPRQRFPGQHLIAFRRDALGFLRRLARDHGDVAQVQISGPPIVLLAHPDHIKDVLVTHARRFHKGRGLERAKRLLGEGLLTSEEEPHLRQRRLIQPAFHRRRIEGYARIMTEASVRVRDRWQDGATVDMKTEMMRLTLAVVGETLFGADVEAEAPEIGAALTDAVRLFDLLSLPFAETLEKLPLPSVRRFRDARARLDATIHRLIAEHRQGQGDPDDLLSMLLAAQDEDDGGGMGDGQIRDEAMTIFLAGHDTTANALSWTWFLLSQHPAVEARMHTELDAVLSGGRAPGVDDLPRLPYTRAVLAESLRLYPPAWVVGRRALEDHPVGDHVIPAGTVILLAQCVTQVDPRWFPDPLRFDPDRWTADAEASRPKFAYFPFGGGPRICIGEQFAWMEGVLLLATLARRWRARLVPGYPVVPRPVITLTPQHGLQMTLEERA